MNDSQGEAASAETSTPAPETEKADEHIRVPEVLPALASGAVVLFPGLMAPLASQEQAVVGAIDEAAGSPNKMLAIFAQKPGEDGQPTGETYAVGTAAVIARMVKAPNGAVQAIIQGLSRITLQELQQQEPWLRVRVERLRDVSREDAELEALTRTASSLFDKAIGLAENVPQELGPAVAGIHEPSHLADVIAANISIKPEERQAVLEAADVAERLRLVIGYLNREIEVLEDLILAATNDAKAKAETRVAEEMQELTGGLQLPPGMQLPF